MAMTHEQYISAVRDLALTMMTPEERVQAASIKLLYGLGTGAYRGRCVRSSWLAPVGEEERHPIVEVAASGEESPLQLAGTTLHELGHVLSPGGHNAAWRRACERLGLRNVKAAGQVYDTAAFDPLLLSAIQSLALPVDGSPAFGGASVKARCVSSLGARGGTSRGKGSGSRLRLFVCACAPPVKARVGHDEFNAVCGVCNTAFKRG